VCVERGSSPPAIKVVQFSGVFLTIGIRAGVAWPERRATTAVRAQARRWRQWSSEWCVRSAGTGVPGADQDQLHGPGHVDEGEVVRTWALDHRRQGRRQSPRRHNGIRCAGVDGATGDGGDRVRQGISEGGMGCHRHHVSGG
jgi:hypothetical protein